MATKYKIGKENNQLFRLGVTFELNNDQQFFLSLGREKNQKKQKTKQKQKKPQLIGLNPFVPNAPFLYPVKTSENYNFFCHFHGVEKGCIGNECVNKSFRPTVTDNSSHHYKLNDFQVQYKNNNNNQQYVLIYT